MLLQACPFAQPKNQTRYTEGACVKALLSQDPNPLRDIIRVHIPPSDVAITRSLAGRRAVTGDTLFGPVSSVWVTYVLAELNFSILNPGYRTATAYPVPCLAWAG